MPAGQLGALVACLPADCHSAHHCTPSTHLTLQDDPSARGMHAYFGTGILALFFVHAGLGLQLGLGL